MTVDLLRPISRHIAQIAENAFEEEQPEYAIESLKIAFQMGMYPTRDLFLATLAVVVSSPDLKQKLSLSKQRKKEAEKTKRYNNFQLKDIEKQTILSAMELVNDLVQSCPDAVARYLPPFHRAYDEKDRVIDKDGNQADDIEWRKEQRDWLRRSANSEGPSSPEDSRANSRNRSPATVKNPIIALAVQMLECNDIFTLLALNPFEMQDATKAFQRIGRDKRGQMSRDGEDDEEAIRAREIQLRSKYDRPGTWILLNILCSFWEHDINLSEKAARLDGKSIRRPHLSKQVVFRNWKVSAISSSSQGNAAYNTELGDALDLIKVGLLPSAESISSKKEKSIRDSKSLAACHLLRLFERMATTKMIDRQTLIRGMSSVMERIDTYAFEKLGDISLLVGETTIFAQSAMRHLTRWQDDDVSSPWDAETEDHMSNGIKDDAWNVQQRNFLRMFQEGTWLLHKVDWDAEEHVETWRLCIESTDAQRDAVNRFLSQDAWQLYPSKTQQGLTKKRNASKTDSAKETENRIQAFSIASEIRRRTVDRVITHIQLQRAVLECLQQYFVKPNPDRTYLALISSKAVTLLAQNIESDLKVVEKCLKGIQNTYNQILEGEVLQGENSAQGESKKRRRIADNDDENEAQVPTVSAEKSLQFVVEWTQVEKKIKRYILILEAAAFSIKSTLVNRKRDYSLSSDLTDLTED